MTDPRLIIASRPTAAAVALVPPTPRCTVRMRAAESRDLPFVDALQKMHGHMVGWFPKKQIEGYLAMNAILVAEDEQANQLGYCIAKDQYNGRDDVGIVYQLNVLPLRQRHLIGASLIKATFERAAYGCKLFCCWCAQDIQAGHFWESVGFLPLAFRTGSRGMQRIHIFWQRRVREDDLTTPYWFPSQTKSGAIREDRIVLPIPPGTHWRDAKPVLLPGVTPEPERPLTLPGGAPVRPRPEQPKVSTARKMAVVRSQSKHLQGLPPGKAAIITAGGIRYIDRGDHVPEVEPPKPKRVAKPRAKNDPKHVAAARELRDRYLEHINTPAGALPDCGKYDVSRAMEGTQPFVPVTITRANLPALPPTQAA